MVFIFNFWEKLINESESNLINGKLIPIKLFKLN